MEQENVFLSHGPPLQVSPFLKPDEITAGSCVSNMIGLFDLFDPDRLLRVFNNMLENIDLAEAEEAMRDGVTTRVPRDLSSSHRDSLVRHVINIKVIETAKNRFITGF